MPAAWKDLHECPLLTDMDSDTSKQRPLFTVPQAFNRNMSLTKVSWKDVHVEAKIFVRQHRFGTGSFKSIHDCVDIATYRRARFWSLDGEFLDEVDPHWMFWQREYDIKKRLSDDLKHNKGPKDIVAHKASADSRVGGSGASVSGPSGT